MTHLKIKEKTFQLHKTQKKKKKNSINSKMFPTQSLCISSRERNVSVEIIHLDK